MYEIISDDKFKSIDENKLFHRIIIFYYYILTKTKTLSLNFSKIYIKFIKYKTNLKVFRFIL